MSALLSLPAYTDEPLARLGLAELVDQLIADEDRVPRNLIDACARRGEEMAERLGALLNDDRYWTGTATHGEWWLLLHAVLILGLMPGERAGLLLVDFMRRMAQAGDDSLQDWLAGYWPALFLNKPEGVRSPLRVLCADRRLDWYIRANALDAAVAGAQQQGSEHLAQALADLATLAADEEEDWELRLSAGNILLDFPRAPYRPLLEGLAARQERWGARFSHSDIEDAYAAAEDKPEWTRFKDPWAFYAPAAIRRSSVDNANCHSANISCNTVSVRVAVDWSSLPRRLTRRVLSTVRIWSSTIWPFLRWKVSGMRVG